MNQKSFTSNFFLNLFVLKNIKVKKRGQIHMNFPCVQELMLYNTHYSLCVKRVLDCVHTCAVCVHRCV